MGEPLRFDYYYGVEAEQFSFYRVPRLLIKDERFKGLSSNAKLLYGLMLDRMALSMKNGWLDDENRAYIIYAVENIMEDLGCSKPTCIKVIRELDSDNGIGLIEKKRRGLGKPDIIYVKNFASMLEKESDKEAANADVSPEVKNLYFKKENNLTSESKEIGLQEVKETDFIFHGIVCGAGETRLNGAIVKNVTSGKCATTDVDGKFALAAEQGDSIEVSYIGYDTESFLFDKEASPNIKLKCDVEIVVGEMPVTITAYGQSMIFGGIVTDRNDRPLEDVMVAIVSHDEKGELNYKEINAIGNTNGNGYFRYDNLPVGSVVLFAKDGYTSNIVTIDDNNDYSDQRIRLRKIQVK